MNSESMVNIHEMMYGVDTIHFEDHIFV